MEICGEDRFLNEKETVKKVGIPGRYMCPKEDFKVIL